MPTLLFISPHDHAAAWIDALRAQVPDLTYRVWPDCPDPADVVYALAWRPPPGVLAGLPNLEVIFSLGAGVDAMLEDPTLPNLPLVRMVDYELTEGMTEYVCQQVLYWHRGAGDFQEHQRRRDWHKPQELKLARERRVGVLGLGVLGADAAMVLKALRFDVAGWSRTPKTLPGIETFHGEEGLRTLLSGAEILVCPLPLTSETEGLLDAELFAALPRGAVVINAARGQHLVEEDLIPALDSGQLAGASLDVFHAEPLPRDHPFWTHPRIVVTPHIASLTQPRTAVGSIADGIRRHRAGEPLINLVDRARGY